MSSSGAAAPVTAIIADDEPRLAQYLQERLAILWPELEIEANQVKASHAASVGPVDEEQLLYLMSRGLGRAEAVDTIVRGFLA